MSNDITVVCSFGNPGLTVSALMSPLERCDIVDVGDMLDDPDIPVSTPVEHVDRSDPKPVDMCTFGSPGNTVSAIFSPLDRGDCIDVGEIITGIIEPPVPPVDGVYLVLNDVPIVLNGVHIIFMKDNHGK